MGLEHVISALLKLPSTAIDIYAFVEQGQNKPMVSVLDGHEKLAELLRHPPDNTVWPMASRQMHLRDALINTYAYESVKLEV